MKSIFWMVWNPNNRNPSVRHASYEQAWTEATRLAKTQPDTEFYILKGIEVFKGEVTIKGEGLV